MSEEEDRSQFNSLLDLRKIVTQLSKNAHVNENDIMALSTACKEFMYGHLGDADASTEEIGELCNLLDNVIETATYPLSGRIESHIEICDSSTDCKVNLAEVLSKLDKELVGRNRLNGNFRASVTTSNESHSEADLQWNKLKKNYKSNVHEIFGLPSNNLL